MRWPPMCSRKSHGILWERGYGRKSRPCKYCPWWGYSSAIADSACRRGVTVSVWKEFAKAYASREETKPELSVLLAPTILPMDLLALTFPMLDSLNHDFLTLVNIVNQPMDLSRWMSFCELRNLRTLLVDTGRLPTRFDERVARGWSAHAIENGAFGQLYAFILCAYNGRHTISRQSMNHLLDLPLLHMVCLRRVHLPKVTDEHNFGWRREW